MSQMLKSISIVDENRTPPAMELDSEVYVHSWQLAFVHDCNMRCEYCITGYGRLGQRPGVMSRVVQQHLLELVFKDKFCGRSVKLDFGNGETFLYYDEFMQFIERAEEVAQSKRIKLSLHVATNGILLDEEKMNALADHNVALTFSIDGPEHVHDRYRFDANRNPTHERAMKNWRLYHDITLARSGKIGCSVTSVISDQASLLDINDFWLSQGVKNYDCTIAEPSDYLGKQDYPAWQERRSKYLEDLEFLAMEQARKLNIPSFLSKFVGPILIMSKWTDLLAGRNAGACGVAESLVGVDIYGNIYPCDNFNGQRAWIIGTLDVGFYKPTLAQFRDRVGELRSICRRCEAEQLCDGGCIATRLDKTLKLNKQGGCTFSKEMADICWRSYQVLLENS